MRITNRWIAFAFLLGGCLLLSQIGHSMNSNYWVNCSTDMRNTSSATLLQNTHQGDIFAGVNISTSGAPTATLSVFDSSATEARLIATILLSTSVNPVQFFNVRLSTAITVTKSDNNSRVQLYWHSMKGVCQ